MNRWMLVVSFCALLAGTATPAAAQDDALGLYFSDTSFTPETAAATVTPGFALAAYVVLTSATGTAVHGYEVGIACTAADFGIPVTSLFFGDNAGTPTNQIVTFGAPKPVAPGGMVLCTVFLTTGSTGYEVISFGPSVPASRPGGVPTVDYGAGPTACSYPFGGPGVAWLNGQPVPARPAAWSRLQALYR